jgi:hypothetical protein
MKVIKLQKVMHIAALWALSERQDTYDDDWTYDTAEVHAAVKNAKRNGICVHDLL